ncbi:unnamed protein product [Rotaria sordida]|uniref:histone acetyltransferase n=1 Tax=Rotaria sordida TaxID=392033 RepID=A0A814CYT9_9BILA|nr:unnamed protein product [Rotaria sordida]CAF0897891.1 unnamed protein product [Rotaria sordida]CAF0908863.1 unnamed protein product [Rotaria sordida]CAF0948410.1 unnamed protein product [Rotaria sordida]CAF0948763.1 unnamed protein product [Rotaria sordida]
MDINEQGFLLPAPLRIFDCSANEVISFKLIQSEKDLNNEENEFAPEFTHQIFGENERIFGYKNLNIDIYCLSSSLNFYLNIDYDEKINPKKYQQFKADDLVESLNQWIPLTTTTNLDLFLSKLKNEHEYIPFGEQILTYQLKEEKSFSYLINRVNQNFCDDKKFLEWYSRLETFLVFFIDAASKIDKDDSNWIIYLLYQQYQNDNGQICYAPIGFITVYLYYSYPDKKRPRISQVLILPPYQRKGHGRRLLTTIYNDLRKDSRVQDITAEDPSDEFIALRDLVSFELCHKYLPDVFSKESILKTNRLTKEMIYKARDICKLTKQETRRVFEICFLQSINKNDEEQMKRFRLIVKRRLFEPLQFDKRRRLQLSDPALEALATDPEKRKKYLSTQYEYVLEHYENILRAFNKYQDKLYK